MLSSRSFDMSPGTMVIGMGNIPAVAPDLVVQPADVAAVIGTALDLPPHVDLTAIEILPTRQVFGGSRIARNESASRD